MDLTIDQWKIRSWKPDDEAAIVKYANNRNISINLRDSFPLPYTLQDARTWLSKVAKQKQETNFAIATPDEAIGGIGLHLQHDVFKHSAEIGYWVGEPFWGRGIATHAVRAFTEFAFASFDLTRIFAGVFDGNVASIRVLEKAGYQLEGRMRNAVVKDGKVLDQLIYAILFSDMKSRA